MSDRFTPLQKKLAIPKSVGGFHLIGALEHYKQDYIKSKVIWLQISG